MSVGPPCLARLGRVDVLWSDSPPDACSACAACPLLRGEDPGEYCRPHQRAARLWEWFAYHSTAKWTVGAAVLVVGLGVLR